MQALTNASVSLTVLYLNAMAAPTSVRVNQPSGNEFWVNPCGVPVEPTTPPYADSKYAEQYARQIGLALSYVNNWIEDFVSLTIFHFEYIVLEITLQNNN